MVDNKETDLGLSLSLNLSQHNTKQHHHQQQNTYQNQHQYQMQAQNINLFPSFCNSVKSAGLNHKASWNPFLSGPLDQTHTSSTTTRPLPNGIDVNSLPSNEDYAGASSPNSTISSQSGKRIERETDNQTDHLDRAACSGSDDEDGENSRKKLRLSKDQSAILEETFKDHNTLNPKQKMILAKQLGLRPRQVEVWFQNRRARTKLKQTEVDCEFLKRCFDKLTEENRRLHKEVQELRALKMSPQFYMQMAPPTTLTMCPSCERVGGQNTQSGAGRLKSVAGGSHWAVTARALDGIRPRS